MLLRKESAYGTILPGRYLPYWRRVIDSLQRQLKLSKDRYLITEQDGTPSATFIKIILDAFDYNDMDLRDHFELFYRVIDPQAERVEKKFDPLINTPMLNRFTKKPIKELILPTTGLVSPTSYSPLDDWDRWKEAKPFRLMNYDSMEFNLPDETLRLDFGKDKPRYLTFCLDVPALVMKFIKYTSDLDISFDEVDRNEFIKLHVLSHIYDDLVDCWLMNFLSACLSDDEDVFGKLLEFSKYNQYVGLSSLNLAYNDINDLVERIRDDKIRLSAILKTDLLTDRTLLDVMNLHHKRMVVGTDRRSIGFELVKSAVLLEILVNVIELQPDKTLKLRRQWSLEYRQIRRSNWKSHIREKDLIAIAKEVESILVLAT